MHAGPDLIIIMHGHTLLFLTISFVLFQHEFATMITCIHLHHMNEVSSLYLYMRVETRIQL